jgi:hypothetical protein
MSKGNDRKIKIGMQATPLRGILNVSPKSILSSMTKNSGTIKAANTPKFA